MATIPCPKCRTPIDAGRTLDERPVVCPKCRVEIPFPKWNKRVLIMPRGCEFPHGICLLCGTHADVTTRTKSYRNPGGVPSASGNLAGLLINISALALEFRDPAKISFEFPLCRRCHSGGIRAGLIYLLSFVGCVVLFGVAGHLLDGNSWWARDGGVVAGIVITLWLIFFIVAKFFWLDRHYVLCTRVAKQGALFSHPDPRDLKLAWTRK